MEIKMDSVCGSLPPGVRGHLRGYVIINIIEYKLDESISFPVAFKIRWWGQVTKGIILQPNTATIKSKKGVESLNGTACYAVRSGLKQFQAYLNDILFFLILYYTSSDTHCIYVLVEAFA